MTWSGGISLFASIAESNALLRSNNTSEVIRQGFGTELLVRCSSGFGKLLMQFVGEV